MADDHDKQPETPPGEASRDEGDAAQPGAPGEAAPDEGAARESAVDARKDDGNLNRTMEVDALEEVEDGVEVPEDALAQVLADSPEGEAVAVAAPPPLPPKKVGRGTIIAGVIIVVIAAGGGIVFGMSFLEPQPVVQDTPEPPPEEVEGMLDEGEFVPILLDEVVVPYLDDELLEEHPDEEPPAP